RRRTRDGYRRGAQQPEAAAGPPGDDPEEPGDHPEEPVDHRGEPGEAGPDPGEPVGDRGEPGADPGEPEEARPAAGEPGHHPGQPGADPGEPGEDPAPLSRIPRPSPPAPGPFHPTGADGGGALPGPTNGYPLRSPLSPGNPLPRDPGSMSEELETREEWPGLAARLAAYCAGEEDLFPWADRLPPADRQRFRSE